MDVSDGRIYVLVVYEECDSRMSRVSMTMTVRIDATVGGKHDGWRHEDSGTIKEVGWPRRVRSFFVYENEGGSFLLAEFVMSPSFLCFTLNRRYGDLFWKTSSKNRSMVGFPKEQD